MSYSYQGLLMDPLEYNILVKLHLSSIEHRRDTILKNIRWRQRILEEDSVGYYLPVQSDIHETEIIQRVPSVYYWRDLVEFPKFTRRLFDLNLTAGNTIRLDVRVNGYPKPEVQWYKDWHPLTNRIDHRIKIDFFEPDLYVLTITNIGCEDQALYSCRANNEAGTANTSAMVTIKKDTNNNNRCVSFYDNWNDGD